MEALKIPFTVVWPLYGEQQMFGDLERCKNEAFSGRIKPDLIPRLSSTWEIYGLDRSAPEDSIFDRNIKKYSRVMQLTEDNAYI